MILKKIRVLVVDDSPFARKVITDGISKDSGIIVAGTASDPFDARDKIIELEPDVMTLDIQMPKMNGIEFLKRLMPQYPLPIVVVSSVSNIVFEAMNAGAVDYVAKPEAGLITSDAFMNELIVKIKIASMAKVGKSVVHSEVETQNVRGKKKNNAVIAIGASTGGTEATCEILKALNQDLPGILIVQHMPPVFSRMYAERLDKACKFGVTEAKDGDIISPGKAMVAPGGLHMRAGKSGGRFNVSCESGENVNGHCPSIDVLFESVAACFGQNALGILLTGMGNDGAKGLLSMKKHQAMTIAQDEATSVVYGMPMVASHIGAVTIELPLEKIASAIYEWAYS